MSNNPLPDFLISKFFTYVDISQPENCWNWNGGLHNGYGIFSARRYFPNRSVAAHRFSWKLHNKQEIPSNMHVCHKCDNPRCVNPSHLFLGTDLDNMHDASLKGRLPRGSSHYSAKLKNSDIPLIREYLRHGYTVRSLGKIFNVSWSAIMAIKRGVTWKHIS